MQNKLKDKAALVTGASKGIGKAIVEELSQYSMKLGLLARSENQLNNVAKYVSDSGSEAFVLKADLNNLKDIEKAAGVFKQKFGAPDYLINNAGIGARGFWIDLSLDEELEITTVNYLAPLTLIRLFLPDMLKLNRGHIININTIGGVYAAPFQGAYCASKAALLAYSSSLAYEMENTNINISSVFLGPTDTDFIKRPNFEGFKKNKGVATPKEVADVVLSLINHPKETGTVGSSLKLLLARMTNLHPRFFRKIIEAKNVPPKRKHS